MKTNTYIQYAGQERDLTDLVQKAKDAWRENGNLIKDIKTLDLYIKPEEYAVYYSINGQGQGKLEI